MYPSYIMFWVVMVVEHVYNGLLNSIAIVYDDTDDGILNLINIHVGNNK